ncbi:hypothetical protein RFX60_11010 [Acinetobacter sp. 11520]|nr:hypothetical protein [Acinetobacter sp. 11520]
MSLIRYQEPDEYYELEELSHSKKTFIRQRSDVVSKSNRHQNLTYLVDNKSCKEIYNNNLNQSYWLLIEEWIKETKAKKDYNDFVEKYFNKPEIMRSSIISVLSQLRGHQVHNKSFINFIRHFPALDPYIVSKNYHISVLNNFIRFHLWHKNLNLVLHFKSDFLVDFYSYDKDDESLKDHLVYSMKGSFSSSSSLRKSYKIERLLALFDREKQEDRNRNLRVTVYQSSRALQITETKERKYENILPINLKGRLVEEK